MEERAHSIINIMWRPHQQLILYHFSRFVVATLSETFFNAVETCVVNLFMPFRFLTIIYATFFSVIPLMMSFYFLLRSSLYRLQGIIKSKFHLLSSSRVRLSSALHVEERLENHLYYTTVCVSAFLLHIPSTQLCCHNFSTFKFALTLRISLMTRVCHVDED